MYPVFGVWGEIVNFSGGAWQNGVVAAVNPPRAKDLFIAPLHTKKGVIEALASATPLQAERSGIQGVCNK